MNKVNLDDAYNGSYYTIVGAGGNLQEWVDGYEKMLSENEIGKPKEWFVCNGRDVNKKYELTGNNRYKSNLIFLFFPLDGLNIRKLAIFKIQMQDRWFDDVVDNNLRRETLLEEM